jgi:hypothetical protein
MMSPRVWLLVAAAWASCACGPATRGAPRFLDQSVRRDLESGSLVVLAKVKSISDSAPRRPLSGFRPIEVNVSVQRVLKGVLNSRRTCVVYFRPNGGYHGPPLEWLEPGETGIFAVEKDAGCFHVVNDRRAIIRSYDAPSDSSAPLDAFVAEAGLPSRGNCRTNAGYDAANDALDISVPLIGSRATWRFLERDLGSSDLKVRACACWIMSQAWYLDEPCLDQLPVGARDWFDIEQARETILKLLQYDQGQFREGPSQWLETAAEGGGLDRALLRFGELLARGALQMEKGSCAALARDPESFRRRNALLVNSDLLDEAAEDLAWKDLDRWLKAGCPTTRDGLGALRGSVL